MAHFVHLPYLASLAYRFGDDRIDISLALLNSGLNHIFQILFSDVLVLLVELILTDPLPLYRPSPRNITNFFVNDIRPREITGNPTSNRLLAGLGFRVPLESGMSSTCLVLWPRVRRSRQDTQ